MNVDEIIDANEKYWSTATLKNTEAIKINLGWSEKKKVLDYVAALKVSELKPLMDELRYRRDAAQRALDTIEEAME